MSDLSDKAALEALAFVGGDDTVERNIDLGALAAHEEFLRHAEKPQLCPFCSMLWDQAEAERLLTAKDEEGYRAWYEATLALPVNEQGEGWGQRGLT